MTQPGSTQTGAAGAAASASRFGGIGSLLMGGLIGAGLASLFGLGAFANVLGFLLQAALIGGVIWLAFNYFRSRNPQPALAGANRGYGRPQAANQPAAGGSSSPSGLNIAPDDFNAFERLLGEIQVAFGKGDMTALGERLTPEMLSYFAGELDANARKRVRNEVSQPKLLQGDLAEAWRESNGEYATVAMRYSIVDATVDIQSGQVVDGSKTAAQQVTEIWTFRRPRGGNAQQWQLSAIQQTRG